MPTRAESYYANLQKALADAGSAADPMKANVEQFSTLINEFQAAVASAGANAKELLAEQKKQVLKLIDTLVPQMHDAAKQARAVFENNALSLADRQDGTKMFNVAANFEAYLLAKRDEIEPWYQSTVAIILFSIIGIAILIFVILLIVQAVKNRKAQKKSKEKEEQSKGVGGGATTTSSNE